MSVHSVDRYLTAYCARGMSCCIKFDRLGYLYEECKKTSTIIGLAILTILTAYISALTLSNQAFAQSTDGPLYRVGLNVISSGKVLAGQEAQVGKVLAGHKAHLQNASESRALTWRCMPELLRSLTNYA
jgi:hypothetical protein